MVGRVEGERLITQGWDKFVNLSYLHQVSCNFMMEPKNVDQDV